MGVKIMKKYILVLLIVFLLFGCSRVQQPIVKDGSLTIRSDHEMSLWLSYRDEKADEDGYIPEYQLKELTIGEGVHTIPNFAFSECVNLERVYCSDSIEVIEESAFYGDVSLRDIHWPKNLRSIEKDAFYGSGLEVVDLPDGLVFIGWYAFMEMPNLKTIILPDSLEEMDYSFAMDPSLSMVSIGNGLTYLGDGLFSNCNRLKEIMLPENITCLKEHVLYNSGIERLIIAGTITTIGSFHINSYNFPKLKQIVFLGDPISEDLDSYNFSLGDTQAAIYYIQNNKESWAPNDESTWMGIPIFAIESLDDLPSL